MPIDYGHVDELQAADKKLLVTKNTAYGNSNITSAGLIGVGTRLLDKVSRLLTMAKNPDTDAGDEPLKDTLQDISNYGILGRMLMDGQLHDRPNTVYLCGPIDMATEEQIDAWREAAVSFFERFGVTCFNPSAAWVGIHERNQAINEAVMTVDYLAILNCDMVLAYLPSNILTLGSIREIEFARSHGKRVVVVTDWAHTSAFSADLECYPHMITAVAAILGLDPEDLMPSDQSHLEDLEVFDVGTIDSEPRSYFIGQKRVPIPKNKFTRRA